MSEKMIQCAGRIEASKENKGLYFMRANTGKPMRLWNFDKPVVIDMQGATFAKEPTPILYYHDDWLPLGVTTEQKVSASAEPGPGRWTSRAFSPSGKSPARPISRGKSRETSKTASPMKSRSAPVRSK